MHEFRMGKSFIELFKALNNGYLPFPWQTRLYKRLVANDLPDALDIPTGLGKTSVMAIWLLARIENPALPRRLVYVVHRRAIVDQATDVADRLHKGVGVDRLAVSTLRGALADNREWMRRPHEPAIVIGTVDMIGSRLLFDAYRAPRWHKSMHAGLLGQDTLIVHDEAHLSVPFQGLLTWIRDRQKDDHSQRPMRVLAMSATGGDGDRDVFALDDKDFAEPAVDRRVNASRRLMLHEFVGKIDVPARLAELAAANEIGPARRVIVFVRSPSTAADVVRQLRDKYKVDATCVALLTGTIRGYERDELVKTPMLQHLRGTTTDALAKSVYLVSTSAGEVGADFDADHLVCDAAALDSVIQRLGRVNRRGTGDALVDLVVDVRPGDKHVLIEPMLKTVEWLRRLPALDDSTARRSASPRAMRDLRTSDDDAYRAAIAPPPACVTPHAATLDAWALTSVQDAWAVAPPLDVYLHGIADYEPPQTSIAWRDEIALFFPPTVDGRPEYDADERQKQFEAWLDLCPLRPRETVSAKSEDVMGLLSRIARRADETRADGFFIRLRLREVTVVSFREFVEEYESKDKQKQKGFWRDVADETFILPAAFGGLSEQGMPDPSATMPATDVADAADAADRLRVWLAADADDALSAKVLGKTDFDLDGVAPAAGDVARTDAWRGAIASAESVLGRMQYFRQFVLRFADEKRQGMLLLFKPPIVGKGKDEKVYLEDHCADVGGFAKTFADALVNDAGTCAAIAFAGRCHDLGKRRPLWQASVGNAAGDRALAKSFKRGMNPATLKHYRHEFGSLIDAMKDAAFTSLDTDAQDVALHLIAVHHGRGRPHFPDGAFEPDDLDKPPALQTPIAERLSPGNIARRYARLQLRYGHWGLAWLESMVTCADHAASRGEKPDGVDAVAGIDEPTEDES